MALDLTNDDLTAVMTWALERISKGEFKEACDAAGDLDSLVMDKDFAPVKPARDTTGTPPASAYKILQEIRNLFPEMVRRGASLRPVPQSKELPEYVRRYLFEASRCFLYGQFLAALFLCRSAIGEGVIIALRRRNFENEVAGIAGHGLKEFLQLAHEKDLLNAALHDRAEEVRRLANQSIHGIKVLNCDECKNAYEATCDLLQHLYQ